MAELASERRVPLLMTRDDLFAGAHSFEGAVTAFTRGGAFTNPSGRRWSGTIRE